MDSKIIKLLIFFFLLPINSYTTEFQGSFKQGSFILGKTNQNSEVYIDKKKVRVTKDGYFVFGIGRRMSHPSLTKWMFFSNAIEKKRRSWMLDSAGILIIEKGAFCVELRPFYCNKRI